MAKQSLKNLNSFSRGYIEEFRSKMQFSTTTVGITNNAIDNSIEIKFNRYVRAISPKSKIVIEPQIGQYISGAGISGTPKIINITYLKGTLGQNTNTIIEVDIPQTIAINTQITMSDTSSGLSKYDLTGNTLSRSKEDIRVNQLIPESVLEYSTSRDYNALDNGGIKEFLDAYYKFMNTEEFVYREKVTFEDIVINNIATFRIPNPDTRDNVFFSPEACKTAQYYDFTGRLLSISETGKVNDTQTDINSSLDIQVTNLDNLPSETALDIGSGRTLSITNLPSYLNRKKIKIEVYLQYYVGPNPSFRLNTIEDTLNINENQEIFLDMMQKEIAPAVSKDILVNKRSLYQRIIDFYKVKGSGDSIETFFKLFFGDQEIGIEYPWDSTLKPSMGNFDNQTQTPPDYNLIVNPITASDPADNDEFGSFVSFDTNTSLAAVGAPGEGTNNTGAVYIYSTSNDGLSFSPDGAGNTPDGKITTANGAEEDKFGSVVSLSGNLVAISSPGDTEFTGGTGANSGSVEIWEKVLTNAPSTFTWTFRAKLVGSTTGSNFGADICLEGDTLAVAVPGHVNSNYTNGAILLYQGIGSNWSLFQTIKAPFNAVDQNGFGEKVVLRDNYLGASWSAYNNNTGLASVYSKSRTTNKYGKAGILDGIPEATGFGEKENDKYGLSIDIDSTGTLLPSAIVGANRKCIVFQRYGEDEFGSGLWSESDVILPTIEEVDGFGQNVKIYADNVYIGASTSSGNNSPFLTNSGLVYHYEFLNNAFIERKKYTQLVSTRAAQNKFGISLDVARSNKNILLIGAPGTSTNRGNITALNRTILDGKYLNNEGFLSDTQKIQDSDFYQRYSYVIKAGQNISTWKDTYNKLVHPAGFKYFGEILLILKATRNVLGDNSKSGQVKELIFDEQLGISNTEIIDLNVYPSGRRPTRQTMSSMPGVQPGYIGIEDLGLLIEIFAALSSPHGGARANRNAKLSISSIEGGSISGVRILDPGFGYKVAPTITSIIQSGGSGGTIETKIDQNGTVNEVILKGTFSNIISTAASKTSFDFDSSTADSNRSASHTFNTVATTNSRTGSGGTVTIITTSDKKIASIQATANALGSGYQVGDILTVAAGALDHDGTASAAFSFTVKKIINGTGYTNDSAIVVQQLSDVAGSGAQFTIGRLTNNTEFVIGTNALTVGAYYKISNKGTATDVELNTLADTDFEKTNVTATSTKWKVGDVFRAESANGGISSGKALKVKECQVGLNFSSFANKKYKLRPAITISPPNRKNTDGTNHDNNLNATAILNLDTELALDDTSRLTIGDRYTIVDMGNISATELNLLVSFTRDNWFIGDDFIANSDGTGLSAATTAFVVPYDSAGKISNFSITNVGQGYVSDPTLNVISNAQTIKVPDVIPIKIVTNGNDIVTIDVYGEGKFRRKTSIDRTNDYFSVKDYYSKVGIGTKRSDFTIEQFSTLSIENVNTTNINKNNINTLLITTPDRNT